MLQLNMKYETKSLGIRYMTLPENVVDTYMMGLTLNDSVFECLEPLRSNSNPTRIKKVLCYLDSFYEEEQNLLAGWINTQLHSPFRMVSDEDNTAEYQLTQLSVLLTTHLVMIEAQIMSIEDMVRYIDKNMNAIITEWLNLRDNVTLLYHKMGRLYPDPVIQDAFKRMANALDNNQDIIILSNKLGV
jgi:hypothetical protein